MHSPRWTLALVFLGLFFCSRLEAAALIHQWSKPFGGAAGQTGQAVAADGSGNVFFAGHFGGSIDLGGGPLASAGNNDIFLVKLNGAGNYIWGKRFGDAANQEAQAVLTDAAGNVIVVGMFQGSVDFGGGPLANAGGFDVYAAKFDGAGNHLWSKRFGAGNFEYAYGAGIDGAGNIYMGGYFIGFTDFGGGLLFSAGSGDIYVAKIDGAGNYVWAKRFGDANPQACFALAADAASNVALTGYITGSVDFGGGALVAPFIDIVLVKLDGAGSHVWSKRFGDGSAQSGEGVTFDPFGNVICTGNMEGSADFGGGALASAGGRDAFVAKFDGAGAHLWSQRFGDFNAQEPQAVDTDANGDVFITGYYQGTVNFGGLPLVSAGSNDIFIAKFSPSGSHLASMRFGDGTQQDGYGIATGQSGAVFLSGSFQGTVNFGGLPIASAGATDAFAVKLYCDEPIPVLIQRFDAVATGDAVELRWDVWTDEAIEKFWIERSDGSAGRVEILATGDFQPGLRSHVDAAVEAGRTYHYVLGLRTRAGAEVRSPMVSATVPSLVTSLDQNHPNPFNPITTIEYTLAEPSAVVVGVYDASGAFVIRLDEGVSAPGHHQVEWNGKDYTGRPVGSGVYFYRLEGVRGVAPRKMVLLK